MACTSSAQLTSHHTLYFELRAWEESCKTFGDPS